MKKVLLGTSAIALAGAFATPADAVEWTVRVGGYMEQYAAYQNPDVNLVLGGGDANANGTFDSLAMPGSPNLDGIDSKQDAEIFFLPSITLDNGLEIGANVQLEANTSGDQIDESYMFIRGSFGELNLGSENSAGYKMMYGAPDVSFVGVNSGSLTAFIPVSGAGGGADIFRGTLGSSFVETLRNNDIHRFTYYTPRFAGLQVGVSYARDNTEDSNASLDCDTNTCDFFDIGGNYVNSFGAFNIAVAGRYGFADTPGGGTPEVWAAGLNVGFGGVTLGGSYSETDGDHGVMEGRYWDIGASYETGPWGFSVVHARGENVDNDCFTGFGNSCIGNGDEELHQYLGAVSYAMAQGVTLNVFGGWVDFEGATMVADNADQGRSEIDGWVIGSGIKINF